MPDKVFVGQVVLPTRLIDNGYVLVSDGVVRHIGEGVPPAGERIGDKSAIILPGAIDSQVHSKSQRDREDFIWSTKSAAAGGVTTIVDMPYDDGDLICTAESFNAKVEAASKQARVDFALYATIDPDDGIAHIDELVEAGAAAFKFSTFGTDPKRFPRIAPHLMHACFARIARHGLMAGVHNEDDETVRAMTAIVKAANDTGYMSHGRARPPFSEMLATAQIYETGAATGCASHVVHCSLSRGYELAAAYRAQGFDATIEACIHYLILDEDVDVRRLGGLAKVNPPIRAQHEREALWRHLAAGNITVVSTDHVSWSLDRKSDPNMFANASGLPGLELLLPLLMKGLDQRGLPMTHVARLLSQNPAQLFRIDTTKGALALGRDADIVVMRRSPYIYDPCATGANVAEWSPYSGMELPFKVEAAFLRGEAIAAHGKVLSEPGTGRFQRPSAAASR